MTIQECYEQMGSDYEEVERRLGTAGLVKRFALKFLNEPCFQNLEKALEQQDGETAFRAAHTLKGICLNLGFTGLYEVSAELTELLRGRSTEGSEASFEKVKEEYTKVIEALSKLLTEESD